MTRRLNGGGQTLTRGSLHVRYENLKHVVLNELLAEHDHAELDAQLDEAAWRSALFKGDTH